MRLKYGRPERASAGLCPRWPIACTELYAQTLVQARALAFDVPVDCVHVAHGELHVRGLFMAVALLSMRHHPAVRVVAPHRRLNGAADDLGACAGYCRIAPFLDLLGMTASAVEYATEAPAPAPGVVWLGAPAEDVVPDTVLVWGSALRRDVLSVPEWRLEDLGERLRPKAADDRGEGAVGFGAARLSGYQLFAHCHGCGFERWAWSRRDVVTVAPFDRPSTCLALAPEREWTRERGAADADMAVVARCGDARAIARPGADPLLARVAALTTARGRAHVDALRASGALHARLEADVQVWYAPVVCEWAGAA